MNLPMTGAAALEKLPLDPNGNGLSEADPDEPAGRDGGAIADQPDCLIGCDDLVLRDDLPTAEKRMAFLLRHGMIPPSKALRLFFRGWRYCSLPQSASIGTVNNQAPGQAVAAVPCSRVQLPIGCGLPSSPTAT
jgi:hypothetical protein